MIDHHADAGPDPLAGRDPHPRERIDYWPLHDARQELLEEIVSQPRPGQSPTRSKALLSVVGIAAALALVVGSAWAVTRDGTDGGGRHDDQFAAAPDATSATTSESANEPTADRKRKPLEDKEVRVDGVRVGTVRLLGDCPRTLERQLTVARLLQLQRRSEAVRYLGDKGDRCRLVFDVRRDKQRRG